MAKPKKTSRKPVKKKTAPKKVAKKKKAAPKKAVARKPAPKRAATKKAAPPKKKPVAKKAAPAKKAAAAKKAAPAQSKPALARKVARDVARSVVVEPRAFIEGKITTDALAEELGEDAVRAMTSGEDEQGEVEGDRVAAIGGPYIVTSIND